MQIKARFLFGNLIALLLSLTLFLLSFCYSKEKRGVPEEQDWRQIFRLIYISDRKQKDCVGNEHLKINPELSVSHSICGLDRGESKASLNTVFLS